MSVSEIHAQAEGPIKKYSSASEVGMGQVQNGHLYIRHKSSSQKNKAEECKKAYRLHLLAILMLNLAILILNLK